MLLRNSKSFSSNSSTDSQMTDTELMSPSSQEAMFNQHSFKDGGKGSYRGTSRGNAEFSNRRNANWVDDGNFEMDKLHLQYIEKSTTEEEFADYVVKNCQIQPEFTKFIHRDNIDWWFCFQKFNTAEEAETVRQFLRNREFKGKRIKAMYARKKETMPSYQQKLQYQQQKQQHHQNFQQNSGGNGTSSSQQYQDYFQEPFQDVATMAPREGGAGDGNRGRRGGSGMGFSHRGGSGSRRQHYQEQNQNNLQPGQESYQTNNANEFGVQKSHHYSNNRDSKYSQGQQNYSHRGALGSRPRGGATGPLTRGSNYSPMDDNNNSFYPPSMRSRLGPKFVPKESELEPGAAATAYSLKMGRGGTFTKKEKKKDVFWISDLNFVPIEPEFKANLVLLESPKNIILQLPVSNVDKQAVKQFSESLQSVGSSLKRIINPQPGRVCLAKTKQSATPNIQQRSPETVLVNGGVENETMTSSNEQFAFKRAVLLRPQPVSDQLNITGASAETVDAIVGGTLNASSASSTAEGPLLTNLDDYSSFEGNVGTLGASDNWKVELIDSGEIVEVEVSNLFNIDRESLRHPVTTFHACFSAFEVVPDESKIATILEYIGIGLTDNDPTYRALRVVYNWVDIEVEMDDQGTMTELLFETNDIILSEASAEWTRHCNIPEITLRNDCEYLGTVTHVKSPAEFYVQLEQVVRSSSNSETSAANQKESCVSNHEAVRALLYETLPSYELTEVPNYRPFPFELVCVKIDNRWLRAQVTQLGWWPACQDSLVTTSSSTNSCSAAESAISTPTTGAAAVSQVEVFCVDHGYSATVKVSDTRPMMHQFIFFNPSNTTGGASSARNDVISAQAIKVSLPGAADEKFSDESLDLFRSEVFRQKVEMKVHKMRPTQNSPNVHECHVKKVTQADSESSEEFDLLQLCVSKGILKGNYPSTGEGNNAVKVEDLEKEILGSGSSVNEATTFDIDLTPTKKEEQDDLAASAESQGELPAELRKSFRPLHQFDEDSSTQFSSDYLDAQFAGVSEKYVEALQEEIAQLKEKVEKLESQMEEMNEFKQSVMKQLKKFRSAFGAD